MKLRTPHLLVVLIVLVASMSAGCDNKAEQSKNRVGPAITHLAGIIERDVKQVRTGFPAGAELLAKNLEDDPGADPEGLKRVITRARAGVHELEVAKSTFFVFVGPDGTMLRSESSPDIAAGNSLTEAIPDSKKFLDPKAGLTEVFGYSFGLRGVQKGEDLQWVVGMPVVRDDKLLGAFVSGWSFRGYTKYLEDDVRRELTKSGKPGKAIPLVYVFLLKGNKAYGAPVTPDVNAELVGKLDLAAKTQGDGYLTTTEIEGRVFAVASRRIPALGPDILLAMMLSEF